VITTASFACHMNECLLAVGQPENILGVITQAKNCPLWYNFITTL